MKILNLLALSVFLLSLTMVSCTNEGKEESNKNTPEYSLGYAYGAQMGKSLKQATMFTEDEKNVDQFVEGMKEALKGDSATVAKAKEEMQARMQSQKPSETPEAGGKIAYNFGLTSGLGDMSQKVDIPASAFDFQGVKDGYVDGLTKDSLEMTQTEMDSVLKAFLEPKFTEYQNIMKAEAEAKAAVAIEAGEAFLAANKEKEGVITTESGLQYEVIQEGTGAKPTAADRVKTHYHGTLIDGTVFDSSVERGEPATFGVGQVIPGWQEGIPLMSEGAKYRFYIPQNLAYGMQAPSPKIPAGSALIFDVELIEVNPE
ncbi:MULTISPECIES: FKBP-type peptidyl-prolyl cis-trans isomerase [unclassified Aureispira]|uniref:FKBP-type peptidyl-prolyl cis-trans isomerase n=1 Tax=unclassified Aureispira TaxID=2649989 RepID=UPI00069830D5|nr:MULTISPECIES: FKBP-type peptidyl-prolyl cis-trans isomerase [unclassified Aureispira]WMX12051.1 FKBP-type peptidyl-prolyl cis-trans isomerase [Aureispira sp. CCB-E]